MTKSLLLLLLSAAVCSLNSWRKEETGTPFVRFGRRRGRDRRYGERILPAERRQSRQQQGLARLFRLRNGRLHKNIYPERNPGVVKELGDLGNDLQVYGETVCRDRRFGTGRSNGCQHGQARGADLPFRAAADSHSKISTSTSAPTQARLISIRTPGRVDVGPGRHGATRESRYLRGRLSARRHRRPGNKLYVANSGGYRAPVYDSTVSVIDLSTFKEIYKINVAINIQKMRLDRSGNLWVDPGELLRHPCRDFRDRHENGQSDRHARSAERQHGPCAATRCYCTAPPGT